MKKYLTDMALLFGVIILMLAAIGTDLIYYWFFPA